MVESELIASSLVAAALGVDAKTVTHWVDSGVLEAFPLNPEKQRGKGARYRFRFRDVFALAVSRHLKSKGFSTAQSILAAEWLLNRDLADLRMEWEQGKRFLFIVGSGIYPQQLTREAIFSNPAIDIEGALQSRIPIAVVDLKAAHDQLLAKLQAGVASAN